MYQIWQTFQGERQLLSSVQNLAQARRQARKLSRKYGFTLVLDQLGVKQQEYLWGYDYSREREDWIVDQQIRRLKRFSFFKDFTDDDEDGSTSHPSNVLELVVVLGFFVIVIAGLAAILPQIWLIGLVAILGYFLFTFYRKRRRSHSDKQFQLQRDRLRLAKALQVDVAQLIEALPKELFEKFSGRMSSRARTSLHAAILRGSTFWKLGQRYFAVNEGWPMVEFPQGQLDLFVMGEPYGSFEMAHTTTIIPEKVKEDAQ